MDFKQLTQIIQDTHQVLVIQATKSVNVYHTLKNWLIGYRIQAYDQNGSDRAVYGDRLIEELANALRDHNVPGYS